MKKEREGGGGEGENLGEQVEILLSNNLSRFGSNQGQSVSDTLALRLLISELSSN